MANTLGFVLVLGWPVLLIGVIVLEVIALRRFEGGWWIAALIPALAMAAAIAVGVLGGMAGSNIAPIWIVFAAPLCLIWIGGMWTLRLVANWLYS